MYSPVAAVAFPDLTNPPDSNDLAQAAQPKDDASVRIRLVRWVSSRKQVFIAELLVRSTKWGK